jgi:hypothetical protein
MTKELDKALADIVTIRSQIAAGTAFQGYGPAAIAITSVIALVTTLGQAFLLEDPAGRPYVFLGTWIAAACLALGIIGFEMRARAFRHHSGLADNMIYAAVENFLPAAAAGLLLPLVILRFAPEATWMIPGLWQLLVGIGTFASARSLPKGVALVAAWYFVCGFVVLSGVHALSPWMMGLPFVAGQFFMAAVLYRSSVEHDAER